jgi:hypothetical protein
MNRPGFTAELSLYRSSRHYLGAGAVVRARATGQFVTPAYPCACGDPNCQNPITSCKCDCQSQPPPECQHCLHLTGCARLRCECICSQGTPTPAPVPCGFLCT